MRLTIIPSDNCIYVDGTGYSGLDLTWVPNIDGKKVHAVQWLDGEGEIEFVGPHQNLRITELGVFEQAIDIWNIKNDEEVARRKIELELEERRKREEEERLKSQFLSFQDDEDEEFGISIDELDELTEKPVIPPTPEHIPPIEPPLVENEEDEDEDLFYDIEELLKEI